MEWRGSGETVMNIRDFYNLPFGKHIAKDKIYEYELSKHEVEGKWIILIQLRGSISGVQIGVHPTEVFVYEDENDRYRYGKQKRKSVTYNMSVGMLFINTDAYMYYLPQLEIMPRGSFKQYVQSEINGKINLQAA